MSNVSERYEVIVAGTANRERAITLFRGLVPSLDGIEKLFDDVAASNALPVVYAITYDLEDHIVKVFIPIDGKWEMRYETPDV